MWLVTLFFFIGSSATATADDDVSKWQPQTVEQAVKVYGDKYGVNEDLLNYIIKCESGFNISSVGDKGKSFGLVQIHLPSHPEVTKQQALDFNFAVEFLSKNIAEGKADMWTCYRNLNEV